MTEQEFITKFNELIKQKPESVVLAAVAQIKEECCKVVVDGEYKSLVAGGFAGLLSNKDFLEVISDSDNFSILFKQHENKDQNKQRGC